MKTLSYRRIFKNEYMEGFFYYTLAYGIGVLLTYIFYAMGIVELKNGALQVASGNTMFFIAMPIIFIVSICVNLVAVISVISLVGSYNKIFSPRANFNQIIPKSNRKKFLEVFKIWAGNYFIYVVISMIFSFLLFSTSSKDQFLMFFNNIFLVMIVSTMVAFTIMIFDSFCRESNLGKVSGVFWTILGTVLVMGALEFVFVILTIGGISNIILEGAACIILFFEGLYALRRIDSIKIN